MMVAFPASSLWSKMKAKIENAKVVSISEVAILAMVAVNYLPFVTRLGPMADDWSHLAAVQIATISGRPLDLFLWSRPLVSLLEFGGYWLFGYSWLGHLGLHICALAASALMLYWVLNSLIPNRKITTLTISCLYIVSPLISVRLWPATISYPQSLFLLFLAMWFSIKWAQERIAYWISSLIVGFLYLMSLLTIELAAPMIVVVPFIVFVCTDMNQRTVVKLKKSILGFLPYLIAGLAWLTFRLYLVPVLGLYEAKSIEIPSVSKFVVETAWPWLGILLTTLLIIPLKLWKGVNSDCVSVILSGLLSGGIFSSAMYLYRQNKRGNSSETSIVQVAKQDELPSYEVNYGKQLIVTGGLLIFLGYMTILFANSNTYELPVTDQSRIAYAMTPGWAIAVAGAGWWLSHRLRCWIQPSRFFLIYSAIFIGLSSAFTVSSSLDYVKRWDLQRHVLRNLRTMAPALADNTYVILTGEPGVIRALDMSFPLLQPFEQRGNGVYVFGASWEVRSILHVLYQNQTLAGDVLKREFVKVGEDNGRFQANGYVPTQVEGDNTPLIVPYERLLVVQYDRQGCVRLVLDGMQIGEDAIPVGVLKASSSRIILSEGKTSFADQILGTFIKQPCWFR